LLKHHPFRIFGYLLEPCIEIWEFFFCYFWILTIENLNTLFISPLFFLAKFRQLEKKEAGTSSGTFCTSAAMMDEGVWGRSRADLLLAETSRFYNFWLLTWTVYRNLEILLTLCPDSGDRKSQK
jgi:hypothetical protein